MRYDADWMSRADERVLEYLTSNGPSTPLKMAESGTVRFSRSYINQHCKLLVSCGLRHLGNGVCDVTADGEVYLAGELDASELERDDEE